MCFYKQKRELKGEASPSSPVTPVKIPDCPVPAWLLEELLRPPPAVSKEPLRNLNSCLQQLKYVLAPCRLSPKHVFDLEASFYCQQCVPSEG